MPKTATKAGNWDYDLRRQVRREHGKGWKLQGRGKKTRCFFTLEDGSQPSVELPIEWAVSNATAIANEVGVLATTMREEKIGLKEAFKRTQQVESTITATGIKSGVIDWQSVAADYLQTKADRRGTTLTDTSKRISNAVSLLTAAQNRPTDGPSLMQAYAAAFFENCPAGGSGRKRHLGDVAAFMDWGIKNRSLPARFKPLTGDERDVLIGTSDGGESSLTPPVKPEQLAALLDALEADGKPELRLAVTLVGCFGLRPAELAALSVEDGRLYVASNVKRNSRSMKNEIVKKLVIALELDGRNDGAKALQLYASGLGKLPRAILNRIEKVKAEGGSFKPVGDEFRQQLERYPFWQSMAAATPGLTPYSLRHGWAWRAHKGYDRPLSVRDAAALMRHTPSTHMRHYGAWTDEESLLKAVADLTQAAAPKYQPDTIPSA